MGKKYLLYIHSEPFADEPKKSALVNDLLAAHYVHTVDPDYVEPEVTITYTPAPKESVTTLNVGLGVGQASVNTCKAGHLATDGQCLQKGCKYAR